VSQSVLTRTEDTSRLDRATDPADTTRTDPDNEQFDRLPSEPLGHDLLKHRSVSGVMRSRWYPGVLQIPIAAVFGLIAGCPLFTFARTMDSNENCNLCGNCVKACPNDAITLTVRKPTKELWFLRTPKVEGSVLAMAIMGIVLIQNVTMLQVWDDVLAWVNQVTGITSYPIIFTAVFAVGVSVPVALLALAAKIAARRNLESTLQNFARFGYALIPLDIAGHVAHNLFHLLAEGKSVFYTVGALFGQHEAGSAALVGNGTIQVLQFTVLALGLVGSLYTVRRLAHRRYRTATRRRSTVLPYMVLIGVLGALNVVLFLFPMAHRM
jgi:ferredoxin